MGLGRPRPPSGLQPGGSRLTGSSREPSLSWRALESLIKAVILPMTRVWPLLCLPWRLGVWKRQISALFFCLVCAAWDLLLHPHTRLAWLPWFKINMLLIGRVWRDCRSFAFSRPSSLRRPEPGWAKFGGWRRPRCHSDRPGEGRGPSELGPFVQTSAF